MGNPRIEESGPELEKGREWYRTASEEQFEAIIDHIRTSHPSKPDLLAVSTREQALRRLEGGDWDAIREHSTGAKHYLMRSLGVTVYVSTHGSAFVDQHEAIDTFWTSVMGYGMVDKGRHTENDRPTKPAQPSFAGDVY